MENSNKVEKGRLIGQGNTAEIYEIPPDRILKLYRDGIPKEACEHEFYVTQNVSRLLGVCPKAYEVVHTDGRIGAIYEKVDGITMLKCMLAKVWTVRKQAKLLAHYHKEIQQEVDFQIYSVKDKLRFEIKKVTELSDSDKEKIFRYIDTLPEGNFLCHFDFHPDNIIINKERKYIIDWMTACVGDYKADVARTCLMLKYAEVPRISKVVGYVIKLLQNWIYQNYRKEYLRISGLTMKDIKKWEIPVAAARLSEWVPEKEKEKLLDIIRKYIDK
ncbi:phosphotransferase [Mobilitalea sibirica]|uniref:Phosphotransferase n=1 Tax=Mobilitalea sibirica TaxID=1462919 RepID=A0A8J7L032_9FIRM|nr:aminoglycoside phosphotransferase family protein [Mobilitalea sibirica]MBH1941508.1 phosphotransferase [Mobilitalea sibirica]